MPPFQATGKRITRRLKDPHGNRLCLVVMRKARGKTQAEIAAAMGCARSVVSRIERDSNVRVETLRKYAAVLGGRCDIVFVFRSGGRCVIVDPPKGQRP